MIIRLKNGTIENKQIFFDFLLEAKDGEYEIKRYKRDRTNEQNRYYRALLGMVEEEYGQDKDDVHEKMRMKFLTVRGGKKELPFCRSTSKLSTQEFSEYIEKIRNFMSEFGMILPDADQFENM